MATITPNVSSSQALIPVGFPLVSVPNSNPVATVENAATAPYGSGPGQSAAQQEAIVQAGDTSNSSV